MSRTRPAWRLMLWVVWSLTWLGWSGWLAGCALVRRPSPPPPAAVLSLAGAAVSTTAPAAAAGPTKQAVTRRTVRTFAQAPAFTPGRLEVAGGGTSVVPPPSPALVREEVTESASAEIPAAQVDRSAEIGARLASMRPIQFLGYGLLVAALAMFWPPLRLIIGAGKQMQVCAGAAGVALIFGPQLLAGNERLLLVIALGGLAAAWGISRLSYKEGHGDAVKAAAA